MSGVSPQRHIYSGVRGGTFGKRDQKDREIREPTTTWAASSEGGCEDVLCPDSQQATLNHRLEGLAHTSDTPPHRVRR